MTEAIIKLLAVDAEIRREGYSTNDEVIAELDRDRKKAWFLSKENGNWCVIYDGDFEVVKILSDTSLHEIADPIDGWLEDDDWRNG